MANVTLQAEPRTIVGKKVSQLRAQGLVPANVYGHHLESYPVQIAEKMVATQVARASRATLFTLELDGNVRNVLVKSVQRHPTTSRVLHVDFYQVAMDEKVHTAVPLHFVGEAPAVRIFKGTLLHNLTEVQIEALPGDLPTSLEVDVSVLATTDNVLHVRDLALPAGVALLTDVDEIIAKVAPPTIAEEEPVEAAAEAAPEAADSGEAAAESGEAAS